MTTRYFDWDNGSDAADGLTPATAWQSYDAKRTSIAASDTILVKRGTSQIISTAFMDARSGVSGSPTIYGVYGEAQVPYAIWKNPTAAGNMILNASGKSNIEFRDMYFDGLGVCTYSLYMFATGATACTSMRVSRCFFTNMASGQSGFNPGGTPTSTGDASGYVIEDCEFFNNPGHGMIVTGAHDVRVRRCKFYGNGFDAPFGGHGFSSRYVRTDATSGWTNTSGTVWQRTLAAYELDVYYVKTSVSGYQRLAKNTSTPTTPGIGQFGVSGGVIYINLNSATNPSSQGINYAWGRCYNLTVEDCESYGNFADSRAPSTEGHGFAFDDYAELSVFRRNKSYNNAGAGFSVNRGDNNLVEANVAYGNGLCGVVAAACWNTNVRHNTLYGNNLSAQTNGEIVFFTYAQNGVITNNILKGTKTYGIDVDTTCAGFSGSNNCVYGYGAIDRSGAYTGTITVDPLLDAEHRATAATVKRGGTYLGGRDFYGKYHTNPPSIGAVSDHPTPGWAAAGRKAA